MFDKCITIGGRSIEKEKTAWLEDAISFSKKSMKFGYSSSPEQRDNLP
jgi:hypothetical protein